MIISSFLCFLTLISLFGYSYIFKKFENRNNEFEIYNDDIFSGILLIILFSLVLNFFFPLKYFSLVVFLLGLVFFYIGKNQKVFKLKIKYYFFIIFFVNYLSYYNGPNVDSPLYHLQTLNWMILNKINLGITNLNIRFGVNSSWHSFLALTNLSFGKLSLKYYLSSLVFSILCYSIFFKKKYLISDIFLFLSICYLLTFTLIHPFVNGPILNHLGNPEVDIVAMFLFIFCFYYFLKFYENNLKLSERNISYFIIIVFLAVSTKISNISLMFLLLIIILFNRKYKLINFSNILVGLTSTLWLIRSFFISGCFIFPIKTTCVETPWTNVIETDYISKVIQSYTRDTRLRENWTNFDHTLYSTDWFVPWFKDYFLNTSILKISTFLLLLSFLILIFIKLFLNKKEKFNKNLNKNYFIYSGIFFIISIYIWMKAPEIRFASGLIISLPCFFLAIVCNKLGLNKYFTHNNTLSVFIILCLLIISKHFKKFEFHYLYTINKGNNNYQYIKKIADIDGVEIYQSLNYQCSDFPKICVNKKRENYKIDTVFNYRIFLSNKNK